MLLSTNYIDINIGTQFCLVKIRDLDQHWLHIPGFVAARRAFDWLGCCSQLFLESCTALASSNG